MFDTQADSASEVRTVELTGQKVKKITYKKLRDSTSSFRFEHENGE